MVQNYPFSYFPPLDALPLPPGWRWDSGFAIFQGLPKDEETGRLVRLPPPCRCLPYKQLATLPEPYIPDGFSVVYCLHFNPIYVGVQQAEKARVRGVEVDLPPKTQEAANYVGAALHLWERIEQHLACTPEGSPLVATALKAGCAVTLSAIWLCDSFPAALQLEAIFKARHNHMRLCPTCVNAPHRMLTRPLLRFTQKPEQGAVAGSCRAWGQAFSSTLTEGARGKLDSHPGEEVSAEDLREGMARRGQGLDEVDARLSLAEEVVQAQIEEVAAQNAPH
jgi:hypothetical protein